MGRLGPANQEGALGRLWRGQAGRGAMDTHWAGYSSYNGALRPPLPGARLASPQPGRSQPELCALHMQVTICKTVAAGGSPDALASGGLHFGRRPLRLGRHATRRHARVKALQWRRRPSKSTRPPTPAAASALQVMIPQGALPTPGEVRSQRACVPETARQQHS